MRLFRLDYTMQLAAYLRFKILSHGLRLAVSHYMGGSGATCFPETHSFIHSFIQLFYPPPSSHPFPPSDGGSRIRTRGGGVRKSEHPVVHPQGEPYIALLLSLFRLPAWSHRTDMSSPPATLSDPTTGHLTKVVLKYAEIQIGCIDFPSFRHGEMWH